MNRQPAAMDELEELIASKDIGSRAEALRRVTDLFVSGSARFSDDQMALFDQVMGQLAREIDVSARAAFGSRLASAPQAPPRVLRELALDDEIAVAEPVLRGAAQLDGATLVEGARTKSQEHLLAISRRPQLSESVTDVLVERGSREVALSTAGNSGAKFSDYGYSTLVERSQSDGELAVCVWSRAESPRQHLLKMFANASESVRQKLKAADPGKADLIRDMVAKAAEQFQAETRRRSAQYAAAEAAVHSLYKLGRLSVAKMVEFACAGKFDETIIALATLSNLPVGLVERAFSQEASEQILVLAKAMGLTWQDTKELFSLKSECNGGAADDLDVCCARFGRLKSDTALKTIQFYRLRERAASGAADAATAPFLAAAPAGGNPVRP
jgi:uncharacterized protein (DUF2336 family)